MRFRSIRTLGLKFPVYSADIDSYINILGIGSSLKNRIELK
jgi:hypothetical protein